MRNGPNSLDEEVVFDHEEVLWLILRRVAEDADRRLGESEQDRVFYGIFLFISRVDNK